MQEKIKGSLGSSLVTFGAFLFLVVYAFARVYIYPAPGFSIDPIKGTITSVDRSDNPEGSLVVGDKLVAVNQATWEHFASDLRYALIGPTRPGDVLRLVVQRAGETLAFDWIVPPVTRVNLFISYLEAALPFAYWVIGTLIFLFVRPNDVRWWLLAVFTYLIGVMTSAATLSEMRIWESALVVRACVWIALPVFWQLHNVFPRTPHKSHRKIFVTLYLLGTCLALAEVFQVIPQNVVYIGGLLTIIGSVVGLVLQYYTSPDYRMDLRIILIVASLALIPTFSLLIFYLFGLPIPWWNSLAYLSLPVIPLSYFYTILRHRLGGLVTRSNRLSTLTVFFFLVFYITTPVTIIATRLARSTTQLSLVAVFMVIVTSFTSIYIFPYFQEWFDRRIMGISIHPSRLLEMYSSNISTSLDRTHLAALLVEKILPSLLVRESAILYFEPDKQVSFLYVQGLGAEDGPFTQDFPLGALQAAFRPLPLDFKRVLPPALAWICLALPMRVDNHVNGYWLFGRRDPDDLYPSDERPTLQAIADQTGIALSNVLQADRLRSMYAADIERSELERLHMATELHDEVLNQLAVLVMKSDILRESEEAAQAYNQAVKTIREAINGLRPAMLYYGLGSALDTLIEEMDDRAPAEVELRLELEDDHSRFDAKVELYLFRIVQQACSNALQHAQPSQIVISARIAQTGVEMTVADDGIGFPSGKLFDLAALLSNKHFGLAGMLERAELIGAQLEIQSESGSGSRIIISYQIGAEEHIAYDPASLTTGHKSIFTHPLV